MFLGPLLHEHESFQLPYAGGCDLGTRTVEPHLSALRAFGLNVTATHGFYDATVDAQRPARRSRSCSPSAATPSPRTSCWPPPATTASTVIRNASPNYMVQDLCFFLEALGVRIEGIGTTTLTVHGVREIDVDVEYSPSEDPIEAMSLHRRRRRHRVRRSPSAGCRSSSSRSSWPPSRGWG